MKGKTLEIVALLALTWLCGCVTGPGEVRTSTMMLDGERQVNVTPGWLRGESFRTLAKAGGFWTDKAPEKFMLNVVLIGTEDITGLKLGMDGTVLEFAPDPLPTRNQIVKNQRESVRRFTVPLEVIEKAVAARRTVIRIETPGRFLETNFSVDQMNYARPAFKKALTKIKATRS